jgi:hypothetical protein
VGHLDTGPVKECRVNQQIEIPVCLTQAQHFLPEQPRCAFGSGKKRLNWIEKAVRFF